MIVEIIFGISETFSSGADIALVYDNMKYEGNSTSYGIFQRNESMLLSMILSISFFIGSILYLWIPSLVFLIPIACLFFSLIILSKIPEFPYKENFSKIKNPFFSQFKNDCIWIFKAKAHLKIWLITGVVINALFFSIYLFLFPIVLKESVSSDFWYGVIYALGVIVWGIGSKFQKYVKEKEIKCWLFLVVLFFGFNLFHFCSYILLGAIFFMRFVWGVFNVFFLVKANHAIENSSLRATFFSIHNSLTNLLSGFLILFFGMVKDFIL